MSRFEGLVRLLPSSLLTMALVGCSSGGPGEIGNTRQSSEGSAQGSGAATTAGSDPATAGKKEGAGDPPKTSGVGPKCTSYLACCDGVASQNAGMASACDATREQIDTAESKGASTASFESACEQALTSMKGAKLCE